MVTGQQVRRLRQKLMQGKTQEAAAAAAGMSVRSAGKWQRGLLPGGSRRGPGGPGLIPSQGSGMTSSSHCSDETQRAPYRPQRSWTGWKNATRDGSARPNSGRFRRALHGPEQEVFFPQVHPPGKPKCPTPANCESTSPVCPFPTSSSSSSSATRGGDSWTWPSERPLKLCRRGCRVRFGPWVGCLRWSAPTISRRLPTSSRKRKGVP